jgi:hypothetical protein
VRRWSDLAAGSGDLVAIGIDHGVGRLSWSIPATGIVRSALQLTVK